MAAIQESDNNNNDGRLKRRRSSTRIDMTPMVDLAFLLLTFFVLTSAFNKPYMMAISMPDKSPDPPTVNARRVLTLMLGAKDNIFWYEGDSDQPISRTSFSVDGVRKLLREKSARIKDIVVLIKPSNASKYKNMVDILDEISISKIAQYAIVDITKEEERHIAQLN